MSSPRTQTLVLQTDVHTRGPVFCHANYCPPCSLFSHLNSFFLPKTPPGEGHGTSPTHAGRVGPRPAHKEVGRAWETGSGLGTRTGCEVSFMCTQTRTRCGSLRSNATLRLSPPSRATVLSDGAPPARTRCPQPATPKGHTCLRRSGLRIRLFKTPRSLLQGPRQGISLSIISLAFFLIISFIFHLFSSQLRNSAATNLCHSLIHFLLI